MPSFRVEMYYVYSYLREDYSPYYIGKGSGKRAYIKGPKEVKPPKDKSRVKIIKDNLTEDESFLLEKLYILMFGRKDLGTGILRNRSDGGDGSSGAVRSKETREKLRQANLGKKRPQWIYDKIAESNRGKKASAETRAKQSATRKGRKCTEEHKKNVSEAKKGFKHTDEAKQKISAARKGKKLSPEHVEKISESGKLKARPHKITFISRETLIVNNISDWVKENGYCATNLFQVKTGKKGRHKDIIKVELID
jgi:hypothetical protein